MISNTFSPHHPKSNVTPSASTKNKVTFADPLCRYQHEVDHVCVTDTGVQQISPPLTTSQNHASASVVQEDSKTAEKATQTPQAQAVKFFVERGTQTDSRTLGENTQMLEAGSQTESMAMPKHKKTLRQLWTTLKDKVSKKKASAANESDINTLQRYKTLRP